MKRYLAAGLALTLAGFGGFLLSAHRSPAALILPVEPTSSQIYIHGTPVCVFLLDGNIIAKVGTCGEAAGPEEDASPPSKNPFSENPPETLPPGHPPVTPDMSVDGPRPIPI